MVERDAVPPMAVKIKSLWSASPPHDGIAQNNISRHSKPAPISFAK